AQETMLMLHQQYAKRRLMVGVDRLDYSKGLPHRFRAFRELLANYPENRMSATLIQIASPTRESVHAYEDIRHQLEGLSGEINGNYGELDWMPVRYFHRTWPRERHAALYERVRRDDVHAWRRAFLAALSSEQAADAEQEVAEGHA